MNINNNLSISKKPPSYLKTLVAACFGTFLEWYDFLTFGALAVTFGPLFFPSNDPSASLLASLATFGVGMVVRPIGAAYFGSLGDQIGRKPVFMITISIMGLATLLVGFLPTYSEIGIWAPILLVALRMLQGFSAGGEIGGSAIYIAEHAGNQYRGFKTSFLQLMGPLGILISIIQITILQKWLNMEQFQSWGWRIPFYISFFLLLIGTYFRRTLEETPVFTDLKNQTSNTEGQLINNFKDAEIRKKMFLLFFCISGGGAVLFFCTQIYLPIFLRTTIKLAPELVARLSIYSTLALLPMTVIAGLLSDYFGRKKIILSGLGLGCFCIGPAFLLIQDVSNNNQILNLEGMLSVGCAIFFLMLSLSLVIGPQTTTLAEIFPAKSRNSAATLPHNLAAGWIGGMLPFCVTWLNQMGNSLNGLWLPTIFLFFAFLFALLYFEEPKKSLRTRIS